MKEAYLELLFINTKEGMKALEKEMLNLRINIEIFN